MNKYTDIDMEHGAVDAMIVMTFDTDVLEDEGFDTVQVEANLANIFDIFKRNLGMLCQVEEFEIEDDSQLGLGLNVVCQHAKASSGASKEIDILDFLQGLAELEAEALQNEDVLSQEGVEFTIQVAKIHQQQFMTYQSEMLCLPIETEVQQPVQFAGDALFYFWVDMDKAVDVFDGESSLMTQYLQEVTKVYKQCLLNIAQYAHVVDDNVNNAGNFYGMRVRFAKYDGVDQSGLVASIKALEAMMKRRLEPFVGFCDVRLEISPSMQSLFRNMHFVSKTRN